MANNPQLRQKLRQNHLAKRENRIAHKEERLGKERERFIEPPTGKQARHQAHASANVEYNPTIRGIRGELATSRAKQKQDTQWYDQLGSEQAQAAQAQEGAAQQFGSSLTQQLSAANAQNAAYLGQMQQQAQAQSALTGQPLEASSGQAAAAGANIGALQNVALNAPTQAVASNQAALTRRLGLASREQGHALAGEQFGARKAIRQDLQAAQKQKGQAYVGRLAEERESARKQQLDKEAFEFEGQQAAVKNAAEQQKIAQAERQNKRGAAVSAANSERTAASSAASTAVSAQSAAASAKNANINAAEFKAERRYKKNHNGRTPAEVAALIEANKPSTSEVNGKKEDAQNAAAAAQTAIRALGKSPATYTEAEWLALEQHLTAPKTGREPGAGISPAAAKRVVEELRRKAEAAKPVVEAASNIKPGL